MQILRLSVVVMALVGCVSPGPAVSKSSMGNVEVRVFVPKDLDVRLAELYIDTLFIGNANKDLPVLYLKRGEHVLRVSMPPCAPYERTITVLGDPNHQVVNVFLQLAEGIVVSPEGLDELKALGYLGTP